MLKKILKNKFGNFSLKLFLFCTILFALDSAIGEFLRYYYFKQESGLLYRTTYSIDSTDANVLIFGASRANHHYHPQVFESRLGGTYYNVGRDGNYIVYHYAVLKSILKRYKPKLIVLDVVSGEFAQDENSYDRLSSLLPYYQEHPEMRPLIELKSNSEKLKLNSKIYPFNSLLTTILAGNLEFNKERKSDIKGYIPLFKEWANPLESDTTIVNYPLDETKLKIFRKFLADCLNANIQLIVVVSPYYKKYKYSDPSIEKAKALSADLGIMMLDFSQEQTFLNNRNYFQDITHLNDKGASVFSQMIIDTLVRYQIKPNYASRTH